ncbi:uncharacterized protein LOC106642098 [Copidosoma floridanum]|uniref:uncharacterized protein LOC106642098 n=1 Tax=Copidosoma floridanum TaxID=29053 RepID=UPI0006C97AF6|nr:uncharacterized protein LOC106642098 [Copidosoma floridanum]
MAPLPAARITPARAFERTGVDYARPFNIFSAKGRGLRASKGYVAVFVCMASKLHDAIQDAELRWDSIAGLLADQGISWRFIHPRAPHFGELWKANVKAMKSHLHRTIGPRNLTYEKFSTVLTSIEAVLNSRPLTPFTGGPDDLKALTPGHFLVNGSLASIIDSSSTTQNLDCLTHWELVRGIRVKFWTRWSHEYLNTLQQRPKWKVLWRNFQINDVVAVFNPTLL